MKLLSTASQINDHLARLIRGCSSCRVAVAWATVGFDASELLKRHSTKIARMVVGTSFFQTHPSFIEAFLSHPNVRFVVKTDGVFHPKLYLFEQPTGPWQCIVGSANFTQGGMGGNDEVAVLVTSDDQGAQDVLDGIRARLDAYWRKATPLTQSQLEAYRAAWKRKRPMWNNLGGKFGKPDSEKSDKGKPPPDVPNLFMTWDEFFDRVKAERVHHTVQGRLKVIQAVRQHFSAHVHFSAMGPTERKQVAGVMEGTEPNWLWFGSMLGAGKFQQAVNNNNQQLSLALDLIPVTGPITREVYLAYIDEYKKAFPAGRHGVATATRLLAMKRPDMFVCLDKRNKSLLCKDFGISQNVNYESYWDSIIARVLEATWWNSPRPEPGMERDVWEARTAFLDSIYYDGTPI